MLIVLRISMSSVPGMTSLRPSAFLRAIGAYLEILWDRARRVNFDAAKNARTLRLICQEGIRTSMTASEAKSFEFSEGTSDFNSPFEARQMFDKFVAASRCD